ncbi:Fc.00g048600.m01.CDS01 [Cosmosporella sp. VM-42]
MMDTIRSNSRSPEESARMQHSCASCRRRKVKCDKKSPCTNCVKHNIACISVEANRPRPRKKRFPEAELLARLRKYEAALTKLGVDPDDILRGEDPGKDSSHLLKNPRQDHEATLSSSPASLELRGHEAVMGPILLAHNDAQDQVQDHVAVGLVFAAQCLSSDLPRLHPPMSQIFHLWQIFVDNVHPLLQIIHLPSLQAKILGAMADLSSASLEMHALLLSIYAIAITAMTDEDCMSSMKENRPEIVSSYCAAAQCALHRANFMHSSDLVVLQAFVLYLFAVRSLVNQKSFPCLTGIAQRIARRNGLNRNRPSRDRELTPFDEEMERRVWWQVDLLDTRAAVLSGVGLAMIDPSPGQNILPPLNVNESELSPGMGVLPEARPWATDAIFVQVRCHVDEFFWQIWHRTSDTTSHGFEETLSVIGVFEKQLEATHLRGCDSRVPLHVMTRYYATYSIAKMKLWAYKMAKLSDLPAAKRAVPDDLIGICVKTIEAFLECSKLKSLERFSWFLFVTFPFLTYVHLFSNLRSQPTGDAADHAWKLLSVDPPGVFGQYKWLSDTFWSRHEVYSHDGMQKAFATLAITAWEAREVAVGSKVLLSEPSLIVRMKRKLGITAGRRIDQMEAGDGLPLPAGSLLPGSVSISQTDKNGIFTQKPNQTFQDVDPALTDPRVELPETATWTDAEGYLMDQSWQNLMSMDAMQSEAGWLEPFLP